MTIVDIDEILYHNSTTVIHLTEEQAIKLVAAIDENMKKVEGMFKGVELMTVPKLVEYKIRVGLWREEDKSQ